MNRARIPPLVAELLRPTIEGLLSGSAPFLDAVREVSQIAAGQADLQQDPDFLLFRAIASESEHLPSASARALCSPEWIQTCDQEIESVRRFYGARITACSRNILARCRP